uniref:(northern house mosquito) hypothetical protein n=1 Tax=Culex pipiens TaxID=7175 RepID=A0A8D8BA65_CULPI
MHSQRELACWPAGIAGGSSSAILDTQRSFGGTQDHTELRAVFQGQSHDSQAVYGRPANESLRQSSSVSEGWPGLRGPVPHQASWTESGPGQGLRVRVRVHGNEGNPPGGGREPVD